MTWRRRLRAFFKWATIAFLVLVVIALVDGWRAFGHRATGERRARMERSAAWKDGHFENPQPLVNDAWGSIASVRDTSPHSVPDPPLHFEPIDPARFAAPPPSGLRVTWLGHSSTLIEIDGKRILTDPVWSDRIGPLDGVGPTRWYPPLVAIGELPPIDAVVVSHDHYDHLDRPTVMALADKAARFIVPLGVGAHLEYWDIPRAKLVELDWWEHADAGGLDVVCTPARHASGRFLTDKDATLWASYALVGSAHRVWYSGDTGLFPAMAEIGEKWGPFDLTMIEVGQYHQAWPDWHIGPEQAVRAHVMVRGKALLPIHWGLLRLAYHGWTEPIERARAESIRREVRAVFPRPGESVEPDAPKSTEAWWPSIPWNTGAADPIVSTQVPPEAEATRPSP
ncbi:MAG: MBL fold metallo-hydrolase [Labilithrix sp.]|nr:MBL fold metallo-hydrolase [Labilithrix sp.]MCW5812091.1 MBL fold metallo-hydrolase [Labilithrix sp.]